MKKGLFLIVFSFCLAVAFGRDYQYAGIPYGSTVAEVKAVFIGKGYSDKGFDKQAGGYVYSSTMYDEKAFFTCIFDDLGLCAIRIDFPNASKTSPVFYAVVGMMYRNYNDPTDQNAGMILWNGDTTMAGIGINDDGTFQVMYYKTAYAQKLFDEKTKELTDF